MPPAGSLGCIKGNGECGLLGGDLEGQKRRKKTQKRLQKILQKIAFLPLFLARNKALR